MLYSQVLHSQRTVSCVPGRNPAERSVTRRPDHLRLPCRLPGPESRRLRAPKSNDRAARVFFEVFTVVTPPADLARAASKRSQVSSHRLATQPEAGTRVQRRRAALARRKTATERAPPKRDKIPNRVARLTRGDTAEKSQEHGVAVTRGRVSVQGIRGSTGCGVCDSTTIRFKVTLPTNRLCVLLSMNYSSV